MGNFVDIAGAILNSAGQKLEVSAQNIANAATPGYRRAISFPDLLISARAGADPAHLTDFTPGQVVQTGNPYDFAILSQGFFCVRAPQGLLYTRAGQFQRDGEGRLQTSQGYTLQASNGSDLVLKGSSVQVQPDGTVVEDGQPTSAIVVVTLPKDSSVTSLAGGFFSVPEGQTSSEDTPLLRQGAFETSNVSTGDEMVRMMESLRQAETGQRLVGVYDDLMGRVLNAFGGAA